MKKIGLNRTRLINQKFWFKSAINAIWISLFHFFKISEYRFNFKIYLKLDQIELITPLIASIFYFRVHLDAQLIWDRLSPICIDEIFFKSKQVTPILFKSKVGWFVISLFGEKHILSTRSIPPFYLVFACWSWLSSQHSPQIRF